MGDTHVTIKLPMEKKLEMMEISKRTGIQFGSLVRAAIYEAIDRHNEKQA